MTQKRDRRFVKGLVIGGVIASLVSLLLAPKTGSELRSDVRRRGRDLRGWTAERASAAKDMGAVQLRNASQQVGPALGSIRERGSSMVDRLRRRTPEASEEEVVDNRQECELHSPKLQDKCDPESSVRQ